MMKCLIFLMLSAMVFTGCSGKEKKLCKEQVTEFLNAYQQQNGMCGEYLTNTGDDAEVKFEGFQAILAEPITFKIKSVKVEDNNAAVNVVIENVDFGKVFENLVKSNDVKMETTEDIIAELTKLLEDKNAPVREFEVSVKLDKDYKIEMTSELSNALLGGYTQYIYELTTGGAQNEKNN